ncbi:MAG: PAS-domain containing protein [Kiloniellales bacterium]|nr:PAS-domain containing protein [Kiloniellales bacterium]
MRIELSPQRLHALGRIAVVVLTATLVAVIFANFLMPTSGETTGTALLDSWPPISAATGAALAASLACLCAFILLVRRNRALARLAQASEALANGDFSIEIPACERSDNLGVAARAIALIRAHAEEWRSRSKQDRDRADSLGARLARLEAALDQSDQALAVIDLDLRITFCNRRFLEKLELPNSFAAGHARLESLLLHASARGLVPATEVESQMARWAALARQTQPGHSVLTCADGTRLELRLKPSPKISLVLLHRAPAAKAARPAASAVEATRPPAATVASEATAPAAEAEPRKPDLPAATSAPDEAVRGGLAAETQAPDSLAKKPTPDLTEGAAARSEATPAQETAQLPPPPSALASTAAHPAARRNFRVLLVEGDKSAQLQAITILDKAGHWVDLTTSGQEAVKAIARRSYDAVLIELELSDISGFDVARLARRLNGPSAQVPIIAMVADRMRFAECLDAGMDDILLKPLRAEDVARKLQSCIGPATGQAQLSGSPAAAAAPDCSRRDGALGAAVADQPETATLRSASGG